MDKNNNLQGEKGQFSSKNKVNFDSKRPDFNLKTEVTRPDLGLKPNKPPAQFTILCAIGNAKTVIDDENSRGNRFMGAINQMGGEIVLIFDKHNGI
jgi:hypothetical protein